MFDRLEDPPAVRGLREPEPGDEAQGPALVQAVDEADDLVLFHLHHASRGVVLKAPFYVQQASLLVNSMFNLLILAEKRPPRALRPGAAAAGVGRGPILCFQRLRRSESYL